MVYLIIILIIMAIVFSYGYSKQWFGFSTATDALSFLSFICALIIAVAIPSSISYYIKSTNIKTERDSIQQTIDYGRVHHNTEKVNAISDIIDINKRIQILQERNKGWFYDSIISDEVDSIELVK
jgi:hypothetical protein